MKGDMTFMKKRILILSSVAMLAIAGATAVALSSRNVSFYGAKATAKEFTFNQAVGAAQFETSSSVVEKSVETGVSSNLETSVSLEASSTESNKAFGDNGYFVRNGSTVSSPKFIIEIGVNNPTSVTVTYGLVKTSSTLADEVSIIIEAYKDSTRLDDTGTSGSSGINSDATFTWNRQGSQVENADRIKIKLQALNGSVYWGEPLYIKSIQLSWSC